jgi:hypothetical protein
MSGLISFVFGVCTKCVQKVWPERSMRASAPAVDLVGNRLFERVRQHEDGRSPIGAPEGPDNPKPGPFGSQVIHSTHRERACRSETVLEDESLSELKERSCLHWVGDPQTRLRWKPDGGGRHA